MDTDYGTVGTELGSAYLSMLAIDSLLSMIAALEVLTGTSLPLLKSPCSITCYALWGVDSPAGA